MIDDALFELPRALDPSFDAWKSPARDYGCYGEAADIEAYEGAVLLTNASGGDFEQKARALASRRNLRGLCIDARTIPQPLIDATGRLLGLERLHLGYIGPRSLSPLAALTRLESLYLEGARGARGAQALSLRAMRRLASVSISGDADAVSSILGEANPNVRYLALGGTESANLRLPDLEFLQRFPGIEYLVLVNVSVKSRSLEPCLHLPVLKTVVVNFARSFRRDTIEALRDKGVPVRCRMDEIRAQLD